MGAGLIVAIGAQNAFVLKQGIRREHRFVIALFCSASDALLIAAGIAGMGFVFTAHPLLTKAIAFAGSAYLAWFAFTCFRSLSICLILRWSHIWRATWWPVASVACPARISSSQIRRYCASGISLSNMGWRKNYSSAR